MSEEALILSLKMDDGSVFKKFIDALKDILTQVRIEFVGNGMFVKAMDDARIVYVEVNIPSASFDNYQCEIEDESDPIQLDLNLTELSKVLNSCGENESIQIQYFNVPSEDPETGETAPAGDNKVRIKMQGTGGDIPRRSRNFTLLLVELPEGVVVEGRLDLARNMMWNIEIPDGLLDMVIKDAEIYSDTIQVNINEDEIEFAAQSDLGEYREPFTDSIDISKRKVKEGKKEVEVETEAVASEYQLAPLKSMLKMSHESSENLFVQMGIAESRSLPIRVKMSVLNGGVFDFYLAPKAEDDFDEDDLS